MCVLGVGYRPAKGAQEWRSTSLGPMFGIMMNLVKANLSPASTAVKGALSMWPADGGEKVVLKDKFFWIVVSQRSPYNGTLGESMWVSWLTLDGFPGFGRMMNFFGPPMELFSGMAYAFDGHLEVNKFEWSQDDNVPIGVCLDGDPVDAGHSITGESIKRAWRIMGGPYPDRVPDHMTKIGPVTPAAKKWLDENPPPKGVYLPPSPYPPKKEGGFPLVPVLLAGLVAAAAYYYYTTSAAAAAAGGV